MIQPLTANLFAGAVPHGFLHIVAFLVGIEGIQPYKYHILVLRLELRLTVDRPGEIPVVRAVLDSDDTAGRYLAGTRIPLADFHDILNDLLVGGCHRSTHPVGRVHIRAEFIRIAELTVLSLSGDGFPHIP